MTDNNFDDNKQKEIVKLIVKSLFNMSLRNGSFNQFVLLGNGSNCKIINDQEDFNNKVDEKEIIIYSDYFRINQDFPIGWYIS